MSSGKNILVAAGLAATLSACSWSETAPIVTPPDTAAPFIPKIAPPQETVECIDRLRMPGISGPQYNGEALANDCKRVQQQGRIALVNFDTPPAFMDAVAHNVPKVIEQATGGLVTPQVEIIKASSKAKQLLRKTSPTCIDDFGKGASKAATATMKLEEYDSVVGISTRAECTNYAAGLGESPGQHSDIFLGSIDDVTEDMKLPPHKTGADEAVAYVIGHEVLHNLFSFGHVGDIVCQVPKKDAFLPLEHNIEQRSTGDKPEVFNLRNYLDPHTCHYAEYTGRPYIMGTPSSAHIPTEMLQPHPVQVDMLLQQADPYNQPQLARPITNQETTIRAEEVTAGVAPPYAIANLQPPVSFEGYRKQEVQFNKVVIVPRTVTAPNDRQHILSVPEVYVLSSESRNIARLGYTSLGGTGAGKLAFDIGGGRLLEIDQMPHAMRLQTTR